ncbi:ATP-dependet DANN helicase Ku type [Thermacetogenium phaeum DSM 12270]|uniref:Non-homologous end joining protein Ku n=2 Tax=Thermacetogenium phaeum TaxID=85874 RepID=K4LGX8_THEPS|nr:Ku protein [Thermacetogenium phaeum]AFV11292.1 ATP-dependet DANN helicase Ku type [Thermacetogenium phaeum DSM 12270]KUK35831.1 MAG: putative DNA repair protein [Thermacetogenium phaeum]
MRPLWQGSISFGLVSIPVKVFPALEDRSIKFRFLHNECHTPLIYERKCPHCNRAVAMEEIVRAYEYEKGRFVVIEEELLNVPGEPLHTVEILDFVRLAEIDPIYFARPYYLAPGLGGEKAYALLHRTMQEQGQVAVARTRLRSKESLVALRVFRQVLLMSQMYYHDEIRPVDAVLLPGKNVELTATELKMASELIGNLSGSFQPEKYQDQYRKRLEEAIAAKIAGEEVKIAPAAPAAKVVDLVEALKASLEMTKEKRDEKVRKRRKKKEAAAGNR